MRTIYFALFSILLLSSCGLPLSITNSYEDNIQNTANLKIPNCREDKTLPNANTTITVNSKYVAKVVNISATGTTTRETKNKQIRFADYKVVDAKKNIVVCGNTGATGSFTLSLEANTAYQLIIYSSSTRLLKANAAVMQDPIKSQRYFLKKDFNTGQIDLNTPLELIANNQLLDSLETNNAGAFNILNQIIKSNTFLKTNTQACSLCSAPFVSTKPAFLEVYWKPGLNPGDYLGGTSSNISFFIHFIKNSRTYYRIFILGGNNGLKDAMVDTDEFDNSVIIHEYAHFITALFSKDSSPGGKHFGIESIDPRLAWSEGFANFFQAAVQDQAFYVDTVGQSKLAISLERQLAFDRPTVIGEGNYREFAIARFLWDIIDSGSDYSSGLDDDGYSGSPADFKWIWSLLTSPSFKSSHFTSMGLFNEIQNLQLPNNAVAWSALRDLHLQHNPNHLFFRSLYGLEMAETCLDPTIKSPLQFQSLPLPDKTNYMVLNKRILKYNHKADGSVLLGLNSSITDSAELVASDLKFYIQNTDVPMHNLTSNYIHKSSANSTLAPSSSCSGKNYQHCLRANLKKGMYLIEVVLGGVIVQDLDFQFFVNDTELCGQHTSLSMASVNFKKTLNWQNQLNSSPGSESNVIFYKLSAPYQLEIKLLSHNKKDSTYQLEARFMNKDFSLKNINLQWQHSKNIKVLTGDLVKTIASVQSKEQIPVTLLIKTKAPLEEVKIYFTATATYQGHKFSATTAIRLNQLLKQLQ